MNHTWNRDALVSILIEAGRYALDQQRTLSTAAISLKSDDTLVTEIDIAVEQQISNALLKLNPDSYIIGEETVKTKDEQYLQHTLSSECWVIDPIDGTVPYAFSFDTWGISIGYMVDSIIREGAIYLPASRLLLISDADSVYIGRGDSAEQIVLEPLQRLDERHRRGIISISQDIARHGTIDTPHPVQSIGSCVYSAAQYLYGKYAAMITNVKLWDIAASISLLEKAGHSMLLKNGAAVRGDTIKSSFLLTAQPNIHHRWSIHDHLFIAPNISTCQTLINNTTY